MKTADIECGTKSCTGHEHGTAFQIHDGSG
jgi:hypothetical protein